MKDHADGKPPAALLARTSDAPGGAGYTGAVEVAAKAAEPIEDSTGSGAELVGSCMVFHEKYFIIQS